jgi:hypothetical protein
MSESELAEQEGIAPDHLPPAIGVDADGLVHHVSRQFPREAVVTTNGEAVVGRHALPAFGIDSRSGWVELVDDRTGWIDEWADKHPMTAREIEAAIARAQP